MANSPVSLKTLLVASKDTEVDFPGYSDFKVKVAFMSRETLVNIRKKATKTSFKNRQLVEEVNDDLFLQMYADHAIKGWSGLKMSYLNRLAPVDLTGQDPEDFLEYTPENALFLMKNSADFDGFISETVNDLGNFQKSSSTK